MSPHIVKFITKTDILNLMTRKLTNSRRKEIIKKQIWRRIV